MGTMTFECSYGLLNERLSQEERSWYNVINLYTFHLMESFGSFAF